MVSTRARRWSSGRCSRAIPPQCLVPRVGRAGRQIRTAQGEFPAAVPVWYASYYAETGEPDFPAPRDGRRPADSNAAPRSERESRPRDPVAEKEVVARRPAGRSNGPRRSSRNRASRSSNGSKTDGLGGYACGTVAGARTRQYHGWYVPAIPPPRRRWMLVAGCEEIVTARAKRRYFLTDLRGPVFPKGNRTSRASPRAVPDLDLSDDRFTVERCLALVRDRSVTIVRYVNRGAGEAACACGPCSVPGRMRSSGRTPTWTPRRGAGRDVLGPSVSLSAAPLPARHEGARGRPDWYRSSGIRVETERGYEPRRISGALSCGAGPWRPVAEGFPLFAGGGGRRSGPPDGSREAEKRGLRRDR